MRLKRNGTFTAMALALTLAGGMGAAFAAAPAPSPGPSGEQAAAPDNQRQGFRERMIERHASIDRKLTTEQVRDIVAGRLALSGNPNLQVGKVAAKAEGVVAVDIVTKTGALVVTREISTRTGGPVRAEGDGNRRHRASFDGRGGRHGRGDMGGGPRGGRMGGDRTGGDRMGGDRMGGFGGNFGGNADRDLNLTVDQVKKLAEARLIMTNNPNLKVGAVKEKDADTITVDIVAKDNSLVVQREINRHSGRQQRPGRADHQKGEQPKRG